MSKNSRSEDEGGRTLNIQRKPLASRGGEFPVENVGSQSYPTGKQNTPVRPGSLARKQQQTQIDEFLNPTPIFKSSSSSSPHSSPSPPSSKPPSPLQHVAIRLESSSLKHRGREVRRRRRQRRNAPTALNITEDAIASEREERLRTALQENAILNQRVKELLTQLERQSKEQRFAVTKNSNNVQEKPIEHSDNDVEAEKENSEEDRDSNSSSGDEDMCTSPDQHAAKLFSPASSPSKTSFQEDQRVGQELSTPEGKRRIREPDASRAEMVSMGDVVEGLKDQITHLLRERDEYERRCRKMSQEIEELERTKEYALEVGFLYDVAKKDLEEEEAENERLTSELRDLETALSTSTEIENEQSVHIRELQDVLQQKNDEIGEFNDLRSTIEASFTRMQRENEEAKCGMIVMAQHMAEQRMRYNELLRECEERVKAQERKTEEEGEKWSAIMDTTISNLQMQMMSGLRESVEKLQRLENDLLEVREENAALKRRIGVLSPVPSPSPHQ